MKSGNLNLLEPCGPLQAFNGTELPLYNSVTFHSLMWWRHVFVLMWWRHLFLLWFSFFISSRRSRTGQRKARTRRKEKKKSKHKVHYCNILTLFILLTKWNHRHMFYQIYDWKELSQWSSGSSVCGFSSILCDFVFLCCFLFWTWKVNLFKFVFLFYFLRRRYILV